MNQQQCGGFEKGNTGPSSPPLQSKQSLSPVDNNKAITVTPDTQSNRSEALVEVSADVPMSQPPKKKRKSPAVPWKKPKDMPKRPLSAYNLFFQQERTRIVNEQTVTIGFESMAKAIASKWRNLDPATKAPFEEKAAVNKKEYQVAVTAWRAKQKEKKRMEKEAAAAAASAVLSSTASASPERHSSFQENYEPTMFFSTQPQRSSSSILDDYPLEWFDTSESSNYDAQEAAFGRHTMMRYDPSTVSQLRGPDLSGGMIESDMRSHGASNPMSTMNTVARNLQDTQLSALALPQSPNIWNAADEHPTNARTMAPPARGRSSNIASRNPSSLSNTSNNNEAVLQMAHAVQLNQELINVQQKMAEIAKLRKQEQGANLRELQLPMMPQDHGQKRGPSGLGVNEFLLPPAEESGLSCPGRWQQQHLPASTSTASFQQQASQSGSEVFPPADQQEGQDMETNVSKTEKGAVGGVAHGPVDKFAPIPLKDPPQQHIAQRRRTLGRFFTIGGTHFEHDNEALRGVQRRWSTPHDLQSPVSPPPPSLHATLPSTATTGASFDSVGEIEENPERSLEILKEDLDDDAMEYIAGLKFDE